MSKRKLPPATIEALIVLIALGLALVAGFAGWGIGHHTRATKTVTVGPSGASTIAAADCRSTRCRGCARLRPVRLRPVPRHARQGRRLARRPRLTAVGSSLSAARLRAIIDHGLGESANPTKPYMPVWGQVISAPSVRPDRVPPGRPAEGADRHTAAGPSGQGAAVQGSVLYVKYGCINCHGPNGLGGVPNPQSPDKTIPPLSGPDFRSEFNTDAKIIDVIRSGSVIGKAPIVSMPHWGGIIPDDQLQALAAYLKTLK